MHPATTPALDTPPTAYPRRWAALTVALTAVFMDLIDATVVLVALPSLRRDLGLSATVLEWTVAGYTLAFAALLIIGGRLGDQYGRKKVFMTGLIGFVITSVLSGAANGPETLLTARILQGATAALMVPQVLSFVQVDFPGRERQKAMTAYGMTFALGGISGPLLGGLLLRADLFGWGWRSVFFINVPLGLLCMLGTALLARDSRAPGTGRLDITGFLAATAALAALFYPLIEGQANGWSRWCFGLILLAVVALAALVGYEARVRRAGRQPLIDPALFRYRGVLGGLAVALVFFCGPAYGFVLTLHLQQILGWTPLHTALTLMPFAVGVVMGSGASVGMVPKLGRRLIVVGAPVMAAGIALVTLAVDRYQDKLHSWQLAPGLILAGLGMASVAATLVTIVLAKIPHRAAGASSGIVNTTLQIGTATGIAVVGTVYLNQLTHGDPYRAARLALLVVVGLILLAAPLGLVLPGGPVPAEQFDEPAGDPRGTRLADPAGPAGGAGVSPAR